jgi:hypothetical protein
MAEAAAAEDDAGKAQHWQERANLLTPVAKAFSTDTGTDVASLAVQIHGGMGYIEETGVAQHLRDARIAQIYEGTNGIQAIDLVVRKLPQSGGRHVLDYIGELKAIADEARQSNRIDFGRMGERLDASLEDLQAATEHLQGLLSEGRNEQALAGATAYLRLFGLAAGGCYLAKAALASSGDSPAATARVLTARAFAERTCPDSAGLRAAIVDGADAITGAGAEILAG